MIEKLENIVTNELLKNVINMKNLKKTGKNSHYFVLLTEFCLFQAQNKFWLCEYPLYSYKSDIKNFCDMCLLYCDLSTFNLEFDDLKKNNVFKTYRCFALL